MGSEEPSALFFVADGAAKERVRCRSRGEKAVPENVEIRHCDKKYRNTRMKRHKNVLQK